jgi:outer membrane protein assembly factor BamB
VNAATRSLLIALAMAAGLSACSSLDKLNPFSGDGKKALALPSLAAEERLSLAWKSGIGGAGEYSYVPAVVGGAVFVAARNGDVTRVENGAQIWRTSIGQVISGGVGSDGTLVVVGTPKSDVVALDAKSGKELWRARAGSEVLSAPALGDGMVVVRSGDSRIVAFDAADGKRRWIYQRATPPLSLRSSVGVRMADGKVFAGFPGGKLAALSSSAGSVVWEATVALPKGTTELERVTDVTSEPVVVNGIVCSVAYQGKLACFEVGNGNAIWSRDVSSSLGIDADSRYVYVTDEDGVIDALDRSSGASIWRQDQLKSRGVGRPLVLGERIAVADASGYVHLLRRTDGALMARIQTDSSGIRAPLIGSGNKLIAQSIDGGVFAIDGAQ